MTTLEELAREALSLSEAASSGPWEGGEDPIDPCIDGPVALVAVVNSHKNDRVRMNLCEDYSMADGRFIARSRTLVPALASEVLRLTELVASLLTTAPKCGGCQKTATRRYFHVAGQWAFACDDDKCMEEDFCTGCGQVGWHTDSEACGAYKDDGEVCTSTTKEPRIAASSVRDVPHAAAIRESGQNLNGSTGQ